MKNIVFTLFLFGVHCAMAQQDIRFNTSFLKGSSMDEYQHFFDGVKATNIGPTIMSGRVVDIEVDPANAAHFYVAFATGGLWETNNNGTSFTPVFNDHFAFGIGDVAIDWQNKIIYVGTGECNSSRSSYAGLGVYKSNDNGKTWAHLGLESTQHISRILVHPTNPNEIYVAAIGHLFTYNKERGVFKTTDGGKTWKQCLSIDEKTGVIDLVFDPQNPSTMYAAAWQRERKAWNFEEAGKGSAIYKTTDAGENWKNISGHGSGFPHGAGVGRIGLAVSYTDSNVLYAFLDNQDHREKKTDEKSGLTKEDFRKMDKTSFLALKDDELNTYLRENEFPEKYTASSVKEMVKQDKIQPVALVEYLEDANTLLFDTPVKGANLYQSNDGGQSWSKTHDGYLENMVFTYGYYFGQVRVNPKNHDQVYLVAFLVARSDDGGKTFVNINGENQHVDHHALYINPANTNHLINGNDGGVNISYDNGKSWIKCIHPEVGQFYTVAVDNAENYNVYGGLQDNGVWYGPNNYSNSSAWLMEGKYPYQSLMGGDGMQIQIDPRDNSTVYTGYQFGSYYRINKATGQSKYITPKHELGERPLRFNWQTPIHLSVHQNDVLYMGANKLYRSLNNGDDFKCISPDLTTGGKQGDVAYSTLTAIHESPMKFGLLYTGSDDGLVHVSKDGGNTWENISKGLPEGYWIRRVVASRYNEGRVYVCLNGHTNDDFTPLLFVSDDYGRNWKKLTENLPNYPVNVIREDHVNKDVLYLGNERGVYVSFNSGKEFYPIANGFPTVPVHDLAIQERESDLIVATHGRSLYKIQLEQIQRLNDSVRSKELVLFPVDKIKYNGSWGNPKKWYEAERTSPSLLANVYNASQKQEIVLRLYSENNIELTKSQIVVNKGLQEIALPLTIGKQSAEKMNAYYKKAKRTEKFEPAKDGNLYLQKGKYKIVIDNGKVKSEQVFEITE